MTAIVRKYGLQDSVCTYRTMQKLILIIRNRGQYWGASSDNSSVPINELPAKAEVIPSLRQGGVLDRSALGQNGGILVSEGSRITPAVMAIEASPITRIVRITCTTPHVIRWSQPKEL